MSGACGANVVPHLGQRMRPYSRTACSGSSVARHVGQANVSMKLSPRKLAPLYRHTSLRSKRRANHLKLLPNGKVSGGGARTADRRGGPIFFFVQARQDW